MAPEVFSGRYNEKCDVWSAGVILFMMVTGLVPFSGKDMSQVRKSVCSHQIDFSKPVWEKVSSDLKDLISRMLEKNHGRRFSASDVLEHRWFRSYHEATLSSSPISNESLENLSRFHAETKLKLTILTYIGTKIMGEDSSRELSRLFKAIDRNNDGRLSYDEITSAYELLGITLEDSRKIFSKIDSDQSGMVEYTEFVTACQRIKDLENRGDLEKTFEIYDVGGDGTLSLNELRSSVPGIESQEWVEFFNTADRDKDGQISLSEFKDYLLGRS